jgi:hypothetical protein
VWTRRRSRIARRAVENGEVLDLLENLKWDASFGLNGWPRRTAQPGRVSHGESTEVGEDARNEVEEMLGLHAAAITAG